MLFYTTVTVIEERNFKILITLRYFSLWSSPYHPCARNLMCENLKEQGIIETVEGSSWLEVELVARMVMTVNNTIWREAKKRKFKKTICCAKKHLWYGWKVEPHSSMKNW
jgi:hypothetical protein